jgi:hypothetical protein
MRLTARSRSLEEAPCKTKAVDKEARDRAPLPLMNKALEKSIRTERILAPTGQKQSTAHG